MCVESLMCVMIFMCSHNVFAFDHLSMRDFLSREVSLLGSSLVLIKD